MTVAVTLFTTCKPFQGRFATIQRNALRSWKNLCPPCEVIVFGDEAGVHECCEELGFRHIPDVARNEFGTPLLSSLFERAAAAAKYDCLAYVNADIMLTRDIVSAAATVSESFDKFLLIARRWNVDIHEEWDFERDNWDLKLRRFAVAHGTLEPPYGGADIFLYIRGVLDNLPPLAIGRTRCDSGVIYQARRRGVPVIDATEVLTCVHQNHDYSHIAVETMGVFKGPEAIGNEKLLGGEQFLFTPLNATHVLTNGGIQRNKTLYPPYLFRKLATLPALYGPLLPLAMMARQCWPRVGKLLGRRASTGKQFARRVPVASRSGSLPYPISINAEPKFTSIVPPESGVEAFDTAQALEINRARIDSLRSLQLPVKGKRVLDVGCGVGHLAQFFLEEQCEVLSVDARKENIERLKVLYPRLEAQVFNLEEDSFSDLGVFDIVFAFGALYHLENPFRALRDLCRVCEELLLIETVISDHYLPLTLMCEETASFNQAIHNIGTRPTPSFVVLALRAAGFAHVYAPRVPPNHPDFRFDWKNDLCDSRDGHLLRCLFVASRQPITNPNLVALLAKS